jgi:hypothetical protein
LCFSSISKSTFSEFEDCTAAKENYQEIRQLVCGYDSKAGLAQELESVWLLLFMASVICSPLFVCTCQIVKYAQQVQLGSTKQHIIQQLKSVSNKQLKFRLALGGPYTSANWDWSGDVCLELKDSLTECLELSPDFLDVVPVESNYLVCQVSHFFDTRLLCQYTGLCLNLKS